jgi:hypothetical protein
MREVQAEHRPTAAEFARRVSERTVSGGSVDSWPDSEPVQVRIDAGKDKVPTALATEHGLAALT